MKVFILALGVVALALSQEVGKVEKFSGKVDKLQKGQVRPQPITIPNTGVAVGDVVRTKSDGSASVSFVDGNKAELGPLTRLDVLEYRQKRSVNIIRGRVLFEVTKLKPGEGFEVRTPTAILGVKGTKFRVYVDNASTFLQVIEGLVEVIPVANQEARTNATAGSSYIIGAEFVRRLDAQQELQQNRSNTDYTNPRDPEVRTPCIR